MKRRKPEPGGVVHIAEVDPEVGRYVADRSVVRGDLAEQLVGGPRNEETEDQP